MLSASLLWAHVCATYPPGLIELWTVLLGQILGFWLPCTIFLITDLSFPEFANRYKLQSERRQPSREDIWKCIRHVFLINFGTTVFQFATGYVRGFGGSNFTVTPEIPDASTVVRDIIYSALLREILFYGIHRLLHHPKVYGRIHKKHHYFTAPIAFSAQYAHPVEHILANSLPVVIPLRLTRAHILSFFAWLTFILLETAVVHSGYDLGVSRMHDKHHEKFRVNFGAIGLMDWLFGTSEAEDEKPAEAKKHL